MEINRKLLVDVSKEFIETASPVSYYEEVFPLLERVMNEYGLKVWYDRKRTAYVTIEGEDNSKTVCVGAHLDTLGLIVRRIEPNGDLVIRQLGGVNYSSMEGASCEVITRDGKKYTGLVICKSHSVHVFEDARTLPRDEDGILVKLDELVESEADVLALGIQHGDIVNVLPEFEYTSAGFIKSRYVDDKCAVGCMVAALDYLKKNDLKPKYKALMAFPVYEEIGHGGAYVPSEVEEYVAVDIGLIGPDYHGSEQKVSICAKDNFSPYDRGLTNKIIDLAKANDLNYAVDVFFHYGTDANAAVRSGNNVYAAAFGMGCLASHGRERTHIKSLEETTKLLIAYLLAK